MTAALWAVAAAYLLVLQGWINVRLADRARPELEL